MNDEERIWCKNTKNFGGSFVSYFAEAVFHADQQNLEILRPVLQQLMEKYPEYSQETKWKR